MLPEIIAALGGHCNFYIKVKQLPLELLLFEMPEPLIVGPPCRKILFSKSAQTYFRLRNACGSQIIIIIIIIIINFINVS